MHTTDEEGVGAVIRRWQSASLAAAVCIQARG